MSPRLILTRMAQSPSHPCNSLEALDKLVPWAQFQPILEEALEKERRRDPGYQTLNSLQLFKAAVLKDLYDLSYDETAFWIQDRLSFQRFVGWSPPGRCIVDSEVLRLFVEFLHWQGVIHPLFDRFHAILEEAGVRIDKGRIVDIDILRASIPGQDRRETRDIHTSQF